MTVRVNLMPDYRQEARARRTRIRHWIIGSWGYGLVLLAGCFFLRVLWGHSDSRVVADMNRIQAQIQSVNGAIVAMTEELKQHQLTLTANRDLIEHPDWGLLLGLLAQSLGDGLVLRQCQISELTPVQRRDVLVAKDQSQVAGRSFLLAIRGMGRSQAAVSQFALRLEQTGLFDQVKLLDTSLEPYLEYKAVSFRVECQLGAGGGDPS